jgi:hypothetical protein
MGLFKWKQDSDRIQKKGNRLYCPYCGADLYSIIEKEAIPVFQVFKNMGMLGNSVTMKTCMDQFVYEQGISCTCGKDLKPVKK